MKREQVERTHVRREEESVDTSPQGGTDSSALTDDLDDILDEIDSVLEKNAQEFVESYVQKGGE